MSINTPERDLGDTNTADRDRPGEFSLDVEERSIGDAIWGWFDRLRSGEPGALPAVLGLVVLAVIFTQVSDRFLSKYNIGNLRGQGLYIAIIALGLVFVLLLGEIDRSAGTAGGCCAAIAALAVFSGNLHQALPTALYWGLVIAIGMAVWLRAWTGAVVVGLGLVLVATNLTQHLFLALVAAVCIGAAIRVLNGYLVAKVGIPSFVATLALFLAWQGVLQFALNAQPINTSNYELWHNLTYGNLSPTWSWVFSIVVVAGYIGYTLIKSLTAKRAGLARDSLSLVLLRGGLLAAMAIVLTYLASQNRNTNPFKVIAGIPWAAAIAITLMIACTIALTKTTWGRHLYATGGNAEAARRAESTSCTCV